MINKNIIRLNNNAMIGDCSFFYLLLTEYLLVDSLKFYVIDRQDWLLVIPNVGRLYRTWYDGFKDGQEAIK